MKNKCCRKTPLFALIIFLIIGVNQIQGIDGNYFVNNIGNFHNVTLYVGGHEPGNYSSIQTAIDDANNGDTIFVYDASSPYLENIVVNKSIHLKGENKNTTIIDGAVNGNAVNISADYVNLDGFTIQSSKDIYRRAGINLTSSKNKITDNIISGNYDGIYLYHSDENTISNNDILNNARAGIGLENSNDNTISCNNISSNNNFGLFFYYSNGNTINYNNVSKNRWDGMVFRYSRNNQIFGNIISSSFWYGINLQSTNNTNNVFYYNSFIDNGNNARGENDNRWDNGRKGNYWDDYEEKHPDANKKLRGVWDTPYDLEGKDNQDRYPLVKPYDKTKEKSVNLLYVKQLEKITRCFTMLSKLSKEFLY